jgi:hypothetical protein
LKAAGPLAIVLALALPGCRTFGPTKERSEVVVAAWAEPKHLPPRGGQVQILVRIQRPNGQPYPGVQVRLRTSAGKLFSAGQSLFTDAAGMTRDRLTSRGPAEVVVQVGATRYRFKIPVASSS